MEEMRSTHMPYCIKKLESGRHIVLNRYYKPLGIRTNDWIDYESHPSATNIKITPATARKLDWDGRDNTECIYLYNDGCIPTDGAAHMESYLQRLGVLMKLTHTPGG